VPDSLVVVISGPSGAGKSTLAAKTAALLGDAVRLNADDYDADWRHPDDLARWIAEGADPNAFAWPTFSEHLRALRAGQAVTRPDGVRLAPARVILAEEAFGRARAEIADCVDVVVWLALPLEVALARRVRRTVGYVLRDGADAMTYLRRMDWYLDFYLDRGVREVYQAIEARVRQDCDLVLDAMQSPDALAAQLKAALCGRLRLGAAASSGSTEEPG
jgi:uridine kinase